MNSAGKIYVVNSNGNVVTTYDRRGVQTKPTIYLDGPSSIAVDGEGKIYVVGASARRGYSLHTFSPDGSPTVPTVTTGLSTPVALTVDDNGKIYVANLGSNAITTYNPDGSATTPTIDGLDAPGGVAFTRHLAVIYPVGPCLHRSRFPGQ